jgi:hypothetical protein
MQEKRQQPPRRTKTPFRPSPIVRASPLLLEMLGPIKVGGSTARRLRPERTDPIRAASALNSQEIPCKRRAARSVDLGIALR